MIFQSLKVFLLGAVIGTSLDWLLTQGGIAFYAHPFLFDTAWWVPFLFGGGVLMIGFAHAKSHRSPPPMKKSFWGSLVFLVLACLGAAFLKLANFQKGTLLFLMFLLSWQLFDRTTKSFFLGLGVALAGCFTEGMLSRMGLYSYRSADFFGLPIWLPFLYFHVSQTAGFLGRVFLVAPDKRFG